MTPPRIKAPVPVVALDVSRAPEAIDVGPSYFREHVLPHLAVVRQGGKVLVPIRELERYIAERASLTIPKGSHA